MVAGRGGPLLKRNLLRRWVAALRKAGLPEGTEA